MNRGEAASDPEGRPSGRRDTAFEKSYVSPR